MARDNSDLLLPKSATKPLVWCFPASFANREWTNEPWMHFKSPDHQRCTRKDRRIVTKQGLLRLGKKDAVLFHSMCSQFCNWAQWEAPVLVRFESYYYFSLRNKMCQLFACLCGLFVARCRVVWTRSHLHLETARVSLHKSGSVEPFWGFSGFLEKGKEAKKQPSSKEILLEI